MTSALNAVQIAALAAADTITAKAVKGVVTDTWPHWRIETVLESESGRNKDGTATQVVVYASFFSRDRSEVYGELGPMANSLPGAIDPDGFRVLGTESRVRQIAGSEEPDSLVYGGQVEVNLIVEPEA